MYEQDVVARFLIESADTRGIFVRLDDTWKEALKLSDYPEIVKQVFGQAMAASVMLTESLKFEGKLTLQIRGNGPVSMIVVQVTHDGQVRGLAKCAQPPASNTLDDIFGEAQMSISITGAHKKDDYQGIVELTGENLGESLEAYFKQSEQLETFIKLSITDMSASGLLLQKLPTNELEDESDGYNRVKHLASTLSMEELSNDSLNNLIHKLFHEEDVRLFDGEKVEFKCHCSRERVSAMIKGLGEPEAMITLEEQGDITIVCEFCNQHYIFDAVDTQALFQGNDTQNNQTHH